MKKNIILFSMSFVVTIIGIFLLSFSLVRILTYLHNYNTYSEVNGKVIGYSYGEDKTKAAVISYVVNDKEYKVNSAFKNSEVFDVGSNLLVKYDSKNPENYILGDETLDFDKSLIGGGLSLIGIIGMIVFFPRKEKKGE